MTFKQLTKQFKTETPIIWKTIQRVLICLGALSAIIVLYPEKFAFLPEWFNNLIFVCSLIGAFLTQFKGTKSNEVEINNDVNSPA